jgi:hypothetical protein
MAREVGAKLAGVAPSGRRGPDNNALGQWGRLDKAGNATA